MGDFDLRKNIFWVGLGINFLVCIIFYFVKVAPQSGSDLENKLKGQRGKLNKVFQAVTAQGYPGEMRINAEQQYTTALTGSVQQAANRFQAVQKGLDYWIDKEKSSEFEKLFLEYLKTQGRTLESKLRGEFAIKYTTRVAEIAKAFRSSELGDQARVFVDGKRKFDIGDPVAQPDFFTVVKFKSNLNHVNDLYTLLIEQKEFFVLKQFIEIFNTLFKDREAKGRKLAELSVNRLVTTRAMAQSILVEKLLRNKYLNVLPVIPGGAPRLESKMYRVELTAEIPFYEIDRLLLLILNADRKIKLTDGDVREMKLFTEIESVRIDKLEAGAAAPDARESIRLMATERTDTAKIREIVRSKIASKVQPVKVKIRCLVLDFLPAKRK